MQNNKIGSLSPKSASNHLNLKVNEVTLTPILALRGHKAVMFLEILIIRGSKLKLKSHDSSISHQVV